MTAPRSRARRALRRVVFLLAALALPTLAWAHGALRAAVPRSGARLAVLPRDLRLTFTEAVELAVARLALTGPDGQPVPLSPVRRGASAAVIVADIAAGGATPLQAGVYTVAWQIAGRDGHPVRGTYRFTILPEAVAAAAHDSTPRRAAPDTVAPTPTPPLPDSAAQSAAARGGADALDVESPLYIVARWLDFAAVLGIIGTAAFGLAVLPGAERRALPEQVAGHAARRARTLGLGAAALLAVASLLRLVAQSAAVNGPSTSPFDGAAMLPLVTGTAWGLGWSLQLGAALVALAALGLARRRPARAWLPVAACAVAAAVGATCSGHAMADEHHPALAFAADALHVLAAGGWAGALLLLAGAALPAVRRATARGPERVAATAALVSAFSPWALACAAVAAATGSTSAWLHLGAPAALWSTPYGRTLLVKLALLVPAAVAGATNWRRVRPALVAGTDATTELSQSVAIELFAATAVLAVTAILVALSPP